MPVEKIDCITVEEPDVDELGPAMLALTVKQRKWVVAYALSGDATASARAAGYSDVEDGAKVRGFNLVRNAKVIGALREWTNGALQGRGAFVAMQALVEIAENGEPEHRIKAADSILDRVGISRQTNHNVSVEHTDNRSTGEMLELLNSILDRRKPKQIEAAAVDVESV